MKHVVGVGDMKVGTENDTIVTHALGSCLGLMVYDPVAKVGGMLHAMLPLSKINPEKAKSNPYMFVDTGIPALFREIYDMGGMKNRLLVKAAGCGKPLGQNETFRIGERNHIVMKKLLWKNGVLVEREDVGGSKGRTVYFSLMTGKTVISSNGKEWEL
jgi:chemotaxis protein CheD